MAQPADLNTSVKDHATELADKARSTVQDRVDHETQRAQDSAASEVEQAAEAARAAARNLDAESLQAQAVAQVAEQLETVASRIRSTDLNETVSQVSSFARRNPALFLGGAALAGFALSRFLKARDPEPSYSAGDDPWSDAPHATNRAEAAGHEGWDHG